MDFGHLITDPPRCIITYFPHEFSKYVVISEVDNRINLYEKVIG